MWFMSVRVRPATPVTALPPLRRGGRTPRILLVGAYERDNLGDLLFLLVTERYVAEAEVVAAAPFAADMRPLLDRRVHAYGPLLRDEPWDVVWTVGGQVGSIDLRRAYRLSASPEAVDRFDRANPLSRARILRRAVGGVRVEAPYIPDLTPGALTIVNSAGLSGIRWLPAARRDRLTALLRTRSSITVRDGASSRFLANAGIVHELAPDAVHAVNRLWPGERDPRSDVAVVQVSRGILGELGLERLAAALAASPALRALRIRLLLAGTANGHDTVEDLERLAAAVRRATPGRDIALLEARRPRELVEEIRRAKVVVGSSLHVRVVAAAFGIGRVSLARPKTTRYARTWDADMPFDVGPDGLDAAVARAVERAEEPEAAAHAAGLSRLAHERLNALAHQALESVPASYAG
jgi:hypothetical protein